MTTEEETKKIKSLIRAVLMSSKDGVEASRLLADYKELTGNPLPFSKMGFTDITSFMRSIPDVVSVRKGNNGQTKFCAVADQSTAHIQKLIANQKRSKKLKTTSLPKYPLRRPSRPVDAGRSKQPQSRRPPLLGRYPNDPNHRPPSSSSVINFRVTVGGATGERAVNQTGKTFPKAFGGSPHRDPNVQTGNTSHSRKSHSSYNVPPRFQKKARGSDEPFESHDYLLLLEQYCEWHQVDVRFILQKAKTQGYLCVIHIHGKAVGSINIYKTELEAKEEAARNVCKQFNITNENMHVKWSGAMSETNTVSTPSGVQVPANIKENIRKLLSTVKVSIWAARLPEAYKEKFGERPENLIKMVRACPDIARFEMMEAANREVIYPLREEEKSSHDSVKPSASSTSASSTTGGSLPSAGVPVPTSSCEPKQHSTTPASQQRPSAQENPFEEAVIPPAKPIGEKAAVYMTYAVSCHNFCLQLETSCCDEMNDKLQTMCQSLPKPNPVHVKCGVFCSALYSADQLWYRAQVLSDIQDNKVKVRFVDHGNEDYIDVDNIRPLPADFTHVPQQVVICSLYGIQPINNINWSNQSLQILAEFARDQKLIATSVVNNGGLYEEVVLYQADNREKSLNDLLVEKNEAYKSEMGDKMIPREEEDKPGGDIPPDEKFLDVFVTTINCDFEVMVRILGCENVKELEKLEASLETYYNSCTCGEEIKVGMVCVACIDSLYHRVKVCTIQDDQVECYLLDYGDVETVNINLLRPLDPELDKSLAYQAVKMELYGLSEVMHERTTMEKLFEFAVGKVCVAQIIEREDGLSAVLYDMQGEEVNINERIVKILISEGHALDLNIFDMSENISCSTPSFMSFVENSSVLGSESGDAVCSNSVDVNTFNISENTSSDVSTRQDWHENSVFVSESGDAARSDSTVFGSAVHSENSLSGDKGVEAPLTSSIANLSITSSDVQSLVPESCDFSRRSDSCSDLRTSTPMEETPSSATTSNKENMPENFEIPAIGEVFEVRIIWFVDPSNFACIPLEKQNSFEKFSEALNAHYAKNVLEEEDPVVGGLYAGIMGKEFYRVIVESIKEGMYFVYMPDYVQHAVLLKDDFQPLRQQFCSFPFLAFHAKLHGIKPTGSTWSEAAKYVCMQMTQSKSLYAYIHGRDDNGVVSLELIDTSDKKKDVCLRQVLLSHNYAKLI